MDEEEVKQIQSKIRSEHIVLSKSAKDVHLIDMPERVMQLKQDKIIQDALLLEFNTQNKDKQCQNWQEVTTTYNINNVVYSVILKLCEVWVKSKLQVGSKKIDFPAEVTQYVGWNISLSKELSTLSLDVPWCIYAVNLPFDGSYYLKRHMINPIPIGLCVLDNTEDFGQNMQWNVEKFCNLLNGIMVVTGGSRPAQYVLLTFLNIKDFTELQNALKDMGELTKEQFIGTLHFRHDTGCIGAIELFTSLLFFSNKDAFEGLADVLAPGAQATVLDVGHLDIDNEEVKTLSDIEFLRIKKNLLVKQCIQKYCTEDYKLVDLFSDGYVAEIGLGLQKEVISLVEKIEDQRKLATRLLDFGKSRDEHPTEPKHPNEPATNGQTNTMERERRVQVPSAQDFLNIEDSM